MSNRRMEYTHSPEDARTGGDHNTLQLVERRLNELEIKASFSEDLLEQLDKVVIRQQQQIDLLIREVTELRQPAANDNANPHRSLRDDMPPHF